MAAIGDGWVDGAWVEAGWTAGAWAKAGGATSPTVDAGGPYASLGAAVGILLAATVTPGSDPAPTYKWTVQSGGAGAWDDDTLEDPTFTPSTNAASVLLLTVSTVDTVDVTDTAVFSSFIPPLRHIAPVKRATRQKGQARRGKPRRTRRH